VSRTTKNLMEAFAGESQANRKYLAYAKKADEEGYRQVARLFRAAAAAETVHAHSHLQAANQVKGTAENLKDAIAGETHEFESMYPKMIAEAREEGEKRAELSFKFANEVEQIHAGLYKSALDNLGDADEFEYYVCPMCGYTAEKHAPDACPICNTCAEVFIRIE